MLRTVSKDNYTLLFEDKDEYIDCIAYETGKPMTVEEIGEILNKSRMSISRYLKSSIQELFYKMKKENKNISSLDIVHSMSLAFNLHTIEEYRSFLTLLPTNIRSEIYEEARA